MALDRNGLAVLGRDECLARLRSARVGRVAVSVDALPSIVPVEYEVTGDGGAVVFRVGAEVGDKVAGALRGAVVAFEVDSIDPLYHRGWSVLVTGTAADAGDERVAIPTAIVSGRVIATEALATPA